MEALSLADEEFPLEFAPTVQHILDKKTLKWIFVGGKGGVGKTTCSSCLATLMSHVRKNVLIISTDPAHNLSDAFGQKFNKNPTLVTGFTNLFAMEIDPNLEADNEDQEGTGTPESALFQHLSIPGIDEAMSFGEVMKQVQNMQFDLIIFDTAPTGHTLRLLSFPASLEKALEKISNLKSKFSGIFNQLTQLMMPGSGIDSEEQFAGKLDEMKRVIKEVHTQFTNANLTTFVCVCIPEFLSLYETERLIQELAKFNMDTDTIIVNQVIFPKDQCTLCQSRSKMQQKYLDQIKDLYEDFHVVVLPLLQQEIRGPQQLEQFATRLLKTFNSST